MYHKEIIKIDVWKIATEFIALIYLKLKIKAGYIYTNKIATLLKMVNMLINFNWKIIKNNHVKNSYCQTPVAEKSVI